MDSVSPSVDHGILFVVDPTNREAIVPEYVDGELVAATDSCLSIAVVPYVDGEIEVSLTTEEVVSEVLHLAAIHTLAVPGGVIAISTADVDRVLDYRLTPGSLVVSVWADSNETAGKDSWGRITWCYGRLRNLFRSMVSVKWPPTSQTFFKLVPMARIEALVMIFARRLLPPWSWFLSSHGLEGCAACGHQHG